MAELTAREKFELMTKQILEEKNNAGNPFMQLKAPDKVGDDNEYRVRLLPQKDGTINIFSEFYRHFYKSKITGKFVEVYCPSTKDQPCPICEFNRKLWESEKESDHKIASYFGRRKNWIIALYVKDDPVNPDNNGTVQVLRYGKQIQDKIENGLLNKSIGFAAMDISEQGIDFLIKAQKQKGSAARSVNYNLSEFDRETTAMCDGDPEQVYEDLCPDTLTSFMPKVKTYAEVKKVLNDTILGVSDDEEEITETPGEEVEEDNIPMEFPEEKTVEEKPKAKPAPAKKPAAKKPEPEPEEEPEAEPEVEETVEEPEAEPEVEETEPETEEAPAEETSDDDDALMDELAELRAELEE